MKKGDATRARIIEAATDLASIRGLAAVSLNDVAEAVGLSKSGLFKHFESKEAMQQAVLASALARFDAYVWSPAEALPPGRARVDCVFDRWIEWEESVCAPGGCLIKTASVELDDQPGPLRDFLHAALQRWRRKIIAEIRCMADPPLGEDRAAEAYFQMKSFILGYGEASRLMKEKGARRAARSAFDALLDRTAA